MSLPKTFMCDSQYSSAAGEVTLDEGSVVATTAHTAECRLCEHECEGDKPTHGHSFKYPFRWMMQCYLDVTLTLLYANSVLPRVALARQKSRLQFERDMYALFVALLRLQGKFIYTYQMCFLLASSTLHSATQLTVGS